MKELRRVPRYHLPKVHIRPRSDNNRNARVSGSRANWGWHSPWIFAQALYPISVIDCMLPSSQSRMPGIGNPIASKFIPQVPEINKGVCPLIGKSSPGSANNEFLSFVTAPVGLHCIVWICYGCKVLVGGNLPPGCRGRYVRNGQTTHQTFLLLWFLVVLYPVDLPNSRLGMDAWFRGW